ncbi:hypothetical protein LguiB_025459 [Lonicera macranthoides]
MAENGLNGDISSEQTTVSTRQEPVVDLVKSPENSSSQQDSDKSKNNEVTNTVPFYKLFSFADSTDYVLMLVGTVASIGHGLCNPLMTVILGEIVNTFGESVDANKLVQGVSELCMGLLLFSVKELMNAENKKESGVSAFSQLVCWIVTAERQTAQIRSLYLKAILRQDVGFFDKEISTGEIVERMSVDAVIIQNAMGEKAGRFIQVAAGFFGGFVIAYMKGWLLTLVLMSSTPALAISSGAMTILMAKFISRGQTAYSAAAIVVEQTIGSIRTVASFTGERQAIAEYDKSLNKAYRAGVNEGLAAGLGSGIYTCFLFFSYALAAWFGARMIINKSYTGGDVINVILAVLTASFSLGQVSPCLSAIIAGQVAAFKMFKTIDRKSGIDPYDMSGQKLDNIHGAIELRNVYFSYPSRPDEQIFNGFSLSIPSGTTTALVGQSGSGKSTVISLIERFYDPQEGDVLIDGINLKDFQLSWIRGKMGLVSQEPVLFALSIKDNIAYGKDGATVEEIKAVAELANAAKFIDKLPQGLDTMVGVAGIQLSGGQKQRIAIARAILKDPRILLLDEATSALDAESERIVQEALERVMVNRTTVIVAHRLTTVKNANMIAVIHHGHIVEKGSHSELLQNSEGAYCQLIRLQELSKDSEQNSVSDQDTPEIPRVDSGGHSSMQVSSAISTVEAALAEPRAPPSAQSHKKMKVSLQRLSYLNKPEIPVLLVGSIAAVANGLILPIFGLILSMVIKTFYEPPHELRKDSEFWALMFAVLGLATALLMPLRTYFFAVAGCKLIKRIRLMCFEKVVQMDISWFDKTENSSGAIGARLSADASSVRGLVGDTLALLVQNTATAIAGLVIGFQASWQLSLITLVLLPLIGLNGYVQIKFISGFSADTKKLYEDASQVASDAVGSIRTVASFNAEEKVTELYQKKCEVPLKAGIKQGLISGTGWGLSMLLLFLVYATIFYAGARLVKAGDITFPQVFRVFYGLSMAAIGISQSGAFAPDTGKAKSAAASIFVLLDQKSKLDSSDDSGTILEDVKGDIEFLGVDFKYPTRPNIQIFRDLCLVIPSGKVVALVGESGCGKSTVISLLQRFYEPDSGRITLDGIEIQMLKLKWLRQQMGLVSQEPVLFNDTIRANIAYGKEGNATEAEILAAAEFANAHKFISGLQQGYDTRVGERGIQLSGGQKQRVAIARAILKAPKILLLDEATSALDAESERVVQDALDRVMIDRTTVVVAHRLSTIKGADLIAVVKNGAIAEKGMHESLINFKNGLYASLVALHTTSSS